MQEVQILQGKLVQVTFRIQAKFLKSSTHLSGDMVQGIKGLGHYGSYHDWVGILIAVCWLSGDK